MCIFVKRATDRGQPFQTNTITWVSYRLNSLTQWYLLPSSDLQLGKLGLIYSLASNINRQVHKKILGYPEVPVSCNCDKRFDNPDESEDIHQPTMKYHGVDRLSERSMFAIVQLFVFGRIKCITSVIVYSCLFIVVRSCATSWCNTLCTKNAHKKRTIVTTSVEWCKNQVEYTLNYLNTTYELQASRLIICS